MEEKNFEDYIKNVDNKLEILSNLETLKEYKMLIGDYLEYIKKYLSIDEVEKVLESEPFKQINAYQVVSLINKYSDSDKSKFLNHYNFQEKFSSYNIRDIIQSIEEDKTKYELLLNKDILSKLNSNTTLDIVSSLNDEYKLKAIKNSDLIENSKLRNYEIKNIVIDLEEKNKVELLKDKDYVQENLKLNEFDIAKVITSLESYEAKVDNMEKYELSNFSRVDVVNSFDEEHKISEILNNKYFSSDQLSNVIKTLDTDKIIELYTQNKEYLDSKKLKIYKVISRLPEERQAEIADKLVKSNISKEEKIKSIAMLNNEVKEKINLDEFPKEYRLALTMRKGGLYNSTLTIDLDVPPEEYKGLDDILYAYPGEYTIEEREKIKDICKVCPEMKVCNSVADNINSNISYYSSAFEYVQTEEWIDNVLESIPEEYTDIQKLAVIHNAVGKKVSYTPEFETEIEDIDDSRALWKIGSSGKGVCNGISKLTQYMLNRVGIDSTQISSGRHVYLKINNIEIPFADGHVEKGATLLDPTWDLANNKFGAKVNHFCLSYEEIRKHDIDLNGKDHKSHFNEEDTIDATINLDEQSLRNIFTSVGLADRDGKFPIKETIDESTMIDKKYKDDQDENLRQQFALLKRNFPDFADFQNSTKDILKSVFLAGENIDYDKCIIDRVYSKSDEKKTPEIFIYMQSERYGEKFYTVDKENGIYGEIDKEKFEQEYDCYEEDKKKRNGLKTWKTGEKEVDLARSSGTITEGKEQR